MSEGAEIVIPEVTDCVIRIVSVAVAAKAGTTACRANRPTREIEAIFLFIIFC
jgi:hypothetical protein